jgi:hypothetical protein
MRCVVLLAIAACSNHRSSPPDPATAPKNEAPAKPRPLEVSWTDDAIQQKFKLTGGGGDGTAAGSEKGVRVDFDHFANGTTYEIAGKKGTIGERGSEMVDIERFDQLGPVAYKDIEHVDTGLTLKLVLPDGRQGETRLPPLSYKYHLKDIFKHAENGPVVFGKEPVDPKPADSLFDVDGDVVGKIIGRAGALQDIDFIATRDRLPTEKGRKQCSGYTGPVSTLTLVLKETEVTIWNRRTGDVVAKKVFPPDKECPMMTFTGKDSTEIDSTPPVEAIAAWLKSNVKR